MIKYITYREENEKGDLQYYILQKDFPHYLCLISELPDKKIFDPAPINEYNLFIVFEGSLRGHMIPSYQNIDKEIKSVMNDMAVWFYNERIIPNEKKYKKWKRQ